ncbi:hypothetical protein HPP92_018982 [Vanilla planifolia]|uniref:Uncharacterized protein n=1 Tax=Vanilla planifolia TaxID=51239 RepID=A0A835Q4Z7_VANPL|nr:hypothetical protein HPP92_018982 [Vanilla planifolia]
MQRRPLRRQTSSPYQRPSYAQRGFHRLEKVDGSGSGWLSKLVDPAARFITGSATKFFPSVFCKRLTALEEDQDKSCRVRVDVPQLLDKVPAESPSQKVGNDLNQLKNSENYGISEIEQLIKQKTYTRKVQDEVDHLIELIHSRAIEPLGLEPENNKDKVDVSEDGNAMRSSTNLLTASTSLTAPEDVAASPAEIAKAYMSSRFPKVTYSAIGLPAQDLLRQDKNLSGPFAVTPHKTVASRSVVRSDRLSGAGYYTPKSLKRSAVCMMSRSPHLKVDSSADAKWSAFKAASNAGFASSRLTMGRTLKSDGKQALKRDNSVLHSERGSLGPIRRVRQKFGLVSGTKSARLISSSLHGSLPLFDKDHPKDSASSQSLQFKNAAKDNNTNQQFNNHGDNKSFSSAVSGYSHNTSRKIFKQLEIFAPPENKLQMKFASRDESLSKLTADMLEGRVLNDLEFVDKSSFASVNANVTSDFIKEKVSKSVIESQLEKQGMVEENGSSKQDILGNMLSTTAGLNKNTTSSISLGGTTISFPAKTLPQRKKAFQISAPEDLLELDDKHDKAERIPEFSFGSRSFDRLLFSSAAYVASDTHGKKDTIVPEFSFASRGTDRFLFSKAADVTIAYLDVNATVSSGPCLVCPTSCVPELLNAGTSVSSLMVTTICSGTNSRGSSFGGPLFLSSKSNGISGFVSAGQQPSILSFSAASNTSGYTANGIGDTVSSVFGGQLAQSGSDSSLFSQNSSSHLCSLSSSSIFGLSSTSPVVFGSSSSSSTFELSSCKQGSSNVPFCMANRSKSFGSVSGFSITSNGASTSSSLEFPFTSSTGISSFSPLFSSNNSANSSNGLSCLTGSSSSSSGFYLASTAASSSLASSNFSLSATLSTLNGSSLGSTFPSSGSSSTGFSFGHATLAAGVTQCSSSMGTVFRCASSGINMSLATFAPISAVPNVTTGELASKSNNNEPMSVEDTMDEDKNTASAPVPAPPVVPTFIQSNTALASQSFSFGSAAFDGKSQFQFGSHQNSPVIQNSNPFQSSVGPNFVPGGNFSLGSGGGEKSTRRIVRVKRDKSKPK